MNKFHKVSIEQYQKDWGIEYIAYDKLKLPKRMTINAAGYDFFSPLKFELKVGETIKISTGIKIELDPNLWLMILPRSGHGFNYRIQLDNSVGCIDQDFFNNIKNEGNIYVKITNDGHEGKTLYVNEGEAFCQGIITNYYKVIDDVEGEVRTDGLGHTSK